MSQHSQSRKNIKKTLLLFLFAYHLSNTNTYKIATQSAFKKKNTCVYAECVEY